MNDHEAQFGSPEDFAEQQAAEIAAETREPRRMDGWRFLVDFLEDV